jgi:hypothetical protein
LVDEKPSNQDEDCDLTIVIQRGGWWNVKNHMETIRENSKWEVLLSFIGDIVIHSFSQLGKWVHAFLVDEKPSNQDEDCDLTIVIQRGGWWNVKNHLETIRENSKWEIL